MKKKNNLCQDEFNDYRINDEEIIISKAEKAYIYDQFGNRYIDFHNGYGTVIMGYSNSLLSEKIKALLKDNLYYVKCPTKYLFYLKELLLRDYPDCNSVAFYTTGTTAVKAAVSAVVKSCEKKIILSAGYHGWDPMWEKADEVFQPNKYGVIDFYFILEKLEELLIKYHNEVCAIVISPDKLHFSDEYYDHFFEIVKKYNILVIDDGVKTAYRYKYGSLLDKWGYKNMMHTASKCISNGARISAVVYNSEYDEYFQEFVYTTFFDTSAAVAAITTIEAMHENNILERIKNLGDYYLTAIKCCIDELSLNIKILGNGNLFQFVFPDDESEIEFYRVALQEGLYYFSGDNQSITNGFDYIILYEAIEAFKTVALHLKQNNYCSEQIVNERIFLAAYEQSEGCPENLSLNEKLFFLEKYGD